VRNFTLGLVVLVVSGCGTAALTVDQGYHESEKWQRDVEASTAYTSADVRMVIARRHPVLKNEVICSEPSPDVAKALSTAFQLSASVKAGTAADVGGGVGSSSAEAIKELAGRTTALLALRDALFKACEGYANGSLGANTYAIVMARYGQLMTTLFLGQDAATSSSAAPAGSVQSPVLNLNLNGAPAASSSDGSKDGSDKKKPTQETTSANLGDAAPSFAEELPALPIRRIQPANYYFAADTATVASSVSSSSDATDSAGAGAAGSGNASPQVPQRQNNPANKDTKNKPGTPAPTPNPPSDGSNKPAGNPPSNPGAWAVRMNEDYFDLDLNISQMLFISCLNEFDPTRLNTPIVGSDIQGAAKGNLWLRTLCDKFDDPDKLTVFAGTLAQFRKELGHPGSPVDPWTPAPTSNDKAAQNANAVAQIQAALLAAGCTPLTVNGKVDDQTLAAIVCYQKKHKLATTGVIDVPTLKALSSEHAAAAPSS
jgi:hypothetical protein